MDICGHNIEKAMIIGIGPLMVQYSTDLTSHQLYQPTSFYFNLHLMHHSIKIQSNVYNMKGEHTDRLALNKKELDEYKKKFLLVQTQIVSMIAKRKRYKNSSYKLMEEDKV